MKILTILIIIFLFISVIDIFSYRSINLAFNQIFTKNIYARLIFFSITLSTVILFVIALIKANSSGNIFAMNYLYPVIGIIVLFYLPKINISIFYGLDSLSFLIIKKHLFLNYIGISISALTFLLVAHGIFINKTNFQVRKQIISSSKIPTAFNNLKIIQISDLHIGSFHNDVESIDKLVQQINKENADLILFTGDMVSNYAGEMDEFMPTLKKLKAKYGKYSILGNHDYGEYVNWKSKEEEEINLRFLIQKHQEIGFNLLNNENITITIEGQSIQLIGVENWGLPPFPQFGNLEQSSQHLDRNKFTVLLSHDPSHWRAQVLNYPFIDLTLSGHTHAMQFGFEFGSWQWSPVSLKYPEWGGLYQKGKQMLYVNRGTGFIGFPGRIGIRPEITELILKSE